MARERAMGGPPGEMQKRRFEGSEAVGKRQQGVASEGHDEGFFSLAEKRRARMLRPGLSIFDGLSLTPFPDGLGIDAVGATQFLERSFQSLYCFSDGVRCRGAAVKYLSHSASFHYDDKDLTIKPWDWAFRGLRHVRMIKG